MQENIKIIHAADLHLGGGFAFLDESKRKMRISELRLTAEKIFGICKANKIDFLLLAGDVFDSNNVGKEDIDVILNGAAEVPQTQVIVALGNHDPLTTDSPFLNYSLPENIHLFGGEDQSIFFEDKNCTVYGSSFAGCYREPRRPFGVAVNPDTVNIMVLHGDTAAGSNYNYISREFLANSGMDYVALGHIHTHTEIQKTGNTYFAYSGCPEPHGFDETGEMGIIAGVISKENKEFSFLPVSRRTHRVVTVDVSKASSNSQITELIENSLKFHYGDDYGKNLYKIVLAGEISEDLKIDKSEIVSRFEDKVFFMKVKDETSLKTDIELLAKEKSLKGEFVRVMLEQIKESPENAEKIKAALQVGLRAFSGEVKFDEDK